MSEDRDDTQEHFRFAEPEPKRSRLTLGEYKQIVKDNNIPPEVGALMLFLRAPQFSFNEFLEFLKKPEAPEQKGEK